MSIRQRKWRDKEGRARKVWYVDICGTMPDGREIRVKRNSPANTRRGAEKYEREIRTQIAAGTYGRRMEKKRIPTFEKFSEEFITNYARANNKPSEVASKESILKHHLIPAFGDQMLDGIGARDIEGYKARKLDILAPKTINNHLAVIGKMLRTASKWEIIEGVPDILLLKVPEQELTFLEYFEAGSLIDAADDAWRCMIVVAVRTGLRQGELRALRWSDVDLRAGRIIVRRAVWKAHIGMPKGGRQREVGLSNEALSALREHRHLRGELVFCNENGSMLTKEQCKWPLWRACSHAGVARCGWHKLRHTFASHLMMRGARLKEIQELLIVHAVQSSITVSASTG